MPIANYTESTSDDNAFEGKFKGEEKPVFPHKLPTLMEKNGDLGLIRSTPFGNTLTKDFAIEAIKGENLGKGKFTDFLAVSFSSTDYVGHQYGVSSIEVEDTYLRLDKDLSAFFSFLEATVGKGNYVLFLTADHGAQLDTQPYGNFPGVPWNMHAATRDKGFSLYDEEVRVPLIVKLANEPKLMGVTTKIPTAHVDIFPSLMQQPASSIWRLQEQLLL